MLDWFEGHMICSWKTEILLKGSALEWLLIEVSHPSFQSHWFALQISSYLNLEFVAFRYTERLKHRLLKKIKIMLVACLCIIYHSCIKHILCSIDFFIIGKHLGEPSSFLFRYSPFGGNACWSHTDRPKSYRYLSLTDVTAQGQNACYSQLMLVIEHNCMSTNPLQGQSLEENPMKK